jgi:hypothetical protein
MGFTLLNGVMVDKPIKTATGEEMDAMIQKVVKSHRAYQAFRWKAYRKFNAVLADPNAGDEDKKQAKRGKRLIEKEIREEREASGL